MKRSTFLTAFAVWVLVAVGTTAFLAWYNLGDSSAVDAAVAASAPVRVGQVLAAPLLLFALGAVIGLLFVYLKDVRVGSAIKTAGRILTVVTAALFVFAAAPVIAAPAGSELTLPTVIVVYTASLAPLLFVAFGALHAIGLAPLDEE